MKLRSRKEIAIIPFDWIWFSSVESRDLYRGKIENKLALYNEVLNEFNLYNITLQQIPRLFRKYKIKLLVDSIDCIKSVKKFIIDTIKNLNIILQNLNNMDPPPSPNELVIFNVES